MILVVKYFRNWKRNHFIQRRCYWRQRILFRLFCLSQSGKARLLRSDCRSRSGRKCRCENYRCKRHIGLSHKSEWRAKRFGMEPISAERACRRVRIQFSLPMKTVHKPVQPKYFCELIQGWNLLMLHKTRGIVLHTTDYSETSIVAKIYTELLACSRTWWTVSVRKREN